MQIEKLRDHSCQYMKHVLTFSQNKLTYHINTTCKNCFHINYTHQTKSTAHIQSANPIVVHQICKYLHVLIMIMNLGFQFYHNPTAKFVKIDYNHIRVCVKLESEI